MLSNLLAFGSVLLGLYFSILGRLGCFSAPCERQLGPIKYYKLIV